VLSVHEISETKAFASIVGKLVIWREIVLAVPLVAINRLVTPVGKQGISRRNAQRLDPEVNEVVVVVEVEVEVVGVEVVVEGEGVIGSVMVGRLLVVAIVMS